MLQRFVLGLVAAVTVTAQYSLDLCPSNSTTTVKGQQFPKLIDATLEELQVGLESGLFTSVDLVNVCSSSHALIVYLQH